MLVLGISYGCQQGVGTGVLVTVVWLSWGPHGVDCWNPAEGLESLEHGCLGLTVGLEPHGMGPRVWL